MICVGEGEEALSEVCMRVQNKKDFSNVTNLWGENKDGSIQKNSITKPVDINKNPIIDTSLLKKQDLQANGW